MATGGFFALRVRAAFACFALLTTTTLCADSFIPDAEAWLENQPKEAINIDALAATLTTPEQAFTFVRDQIAYEPYSGTMKGPSGTLITRGANDVDRCLLLAKLLNAQGIESQFVVGTLDDTQRKTLFQQVQQSRSAAARMIASIHAPKKSSETSGETDELASKTASGFSPAVLEQQLRRRAADRAGLLHLDEQAGWADVSSLVKLTTPTSVSIPTEHVWLRATIGEKSVDLDPSFTNASLGKRLGAERETLDADAVTERFAHTVTVRVAADFLVKDALLHRELLAQTMKAADLLSTGFRLSVVPKTSADHLGDFRPLLLIGDQVNEGHPFRLHGAPTPEKSTEAPAGPGGLLGGFGGGGDEKETTPSAADVELATADLGRLIFEFVFHRPGEEDEVASRAILDRLTQCKAGWRIAAAFSKEERVQPLLMQTWDGALDVGAPHLLAVFQNQADSLKALDPIRAAVAEGHALSPGDLPTLVPAPQLEGFFLASALRREALRSHGFSSVRTFYSRPRIAMLRHGFAVGDWTDPTAVAPRYEEGIDLLNSPVHFLGENAVEAAFRSGISDTSIEQYVLNERARLNTLPLFAAVHEQKIDLLTLSETADVKKIAVPDAIRAAIVRDLQAGRRVLAPVQMVRFERGHAYGWWSLDPKTGYVVGKMDLGGAQGLAEASEINERITEWTEAYVKFLGNVLKCYQGALEDALGSVKPNYKNLSIDVTINHGNDPSPNTQVLIGCLKDAACDALKDFVATELNSVACFQETKEIEDMLLAWEEQQLISNSADAAGKMCQKALG